MELERTEGRVGQIVDLGLKFLHGTREAARPRDLMVGTGKLPCAALSSAGRMGILNAHQT